MALTKISNAQRGKRTWLTEALRSIWICKVFLNLRTQELCDEPDCSAIPSYYRLS